MCNNVLCPCSASVTKKSWGKFGFHQSKPSDSGIPGPQLQCFTVGGSSTPTSYRMPQLQSFASGGLSSPSSCRGQASGLVLSFLFPLVFPPFRPLLLEREVVMTPFPPSHYAGLCIFEMMRGRRCGPESHHKKPACSKGARKRERTKAP